MPQKFLRRAVRPAAKRAFRPAGAAASATIRDRLIVRPNTAYPGKRKQGARHEGTAKRRRANREFCRRNRDGRDRILPGQQAIFRSMSRRPPSGAKALIVLEINRDFTNQPVWEIERHVVASLASA
jgi:hypothetical protein